MRLVAMTLPSGFSVGIQPLTNRDVLPSFRCGRDGFVEIPTSRVPSWSWGSRLLSRSQIDSIAGELGRMVSAHRPVGIHGDVGAGSGRPSALGVRIPLPAWDRFADRQVSPERRYFCVISPPGGGTDEIPAETVKAVLDEFDAFRRDQPEEFFRRRRMAADATRRIAARRDSDREKTYRRCGFGAQEVAP